MKSSGVIGNSHATIAILAGSLCVTAVIAVSQLYLRRDVFDPHSLGPFEYQFLFQDYPGSLVVLVVLLLGLAPSVQRMGHALASFVGWHPVATAVALSLGLSAGALWIYQAHPLTMDEYAPYLQSEIFAAGHLAGRWPPDLIGWLIFPAYQDWFVKVSGETGEIASVYWPGFSLVLTPFMALGAPWLANPVIGGLSLLAVHRLALVLTGSRHAAGAAALFCIASPAFTANAVSFYSMSTHLLCNAVYVLLLLSPSPLKCALAGGVGGLALTLHNPAPHVLFSVPWIIWLAARRDRLRLLPALMAGYLPWAVLPAFGWLQFLSTLGNPGDGLHASGNGGLLGRVLGALAAVSVVPDAHLLAVRLIGFAKVWLWAVPALLVVAGVGLFKHRSDLRYWLLMASTALTWVGYMFVPFDQGFGWGFRYFHSVWFVIPVFAAAALVPVARDDSEPSGHMESSSASYMHATALVSLVMLTTYFAWQMHGYISGHLAQMPTTDERAKVVIIYPGAGYYSVDLVQNDPFLRDPLILMVTRGRAADTQMIERHFPGMILLDRSHRGSVWGYPENPVPSLGAGPVGQQHRQQE